MTAPAYLRLAVALEPVPAAGSASRPRPFPAPVLRGMLGKALVDRFCPWGEPRCNPKGAKRSTTTPADLCRLAEACPYGVLFAASRSRRPPFALFVPDDGDPAATHAGAGGSATDGETVAADTGAAGSAFGTEPPRSGERPTRSIELTLYGPAWTAHAWVVQALRDALAERVGDRGGWRIAQVARVRPDRTFELLAQAHQDRTPEAGPDLRALPADLRPDLCALPADLRPDLLGLAPEPFLAPAPVAVRLRSPTHLLLRGKPVPRDRPVPFDLLVKSALDRFAGLYGEDASPVLARDIRPVIEAEAAKVPLIEQDVRSAEASHHSQRSRARLDLGGTVGRLLYAPQAAAFFHILRAAEVLHVGKNPTFGCGRIQVDLA